MIGDAAHLLAPGRQVGQERGHDAEAKRSGSPGSRVSHVLSSPSGLGPGAGSYHCDERRGPVGTAASRAIPRTLPTCPTTPSRPSRQRPSTTSPLSSSATRACSPTAGAPGSTPTTGSRTAPPRTTGRSRSGAWKRGSRTPRWSTTVTSPSPGRSTAHTRRPGIHHRKEYLATAERLPDYRVTCIQVERAHRGQGLAAVALRGAVELIAQAGGGRVEGYPHDTGGVRRRTRRSSTTAPARCTSVRASPTTGPRDWATA